MTIMRMDRLEAIAYWAKQIFLRQEALEGMSRDPNEHEVQYQERRIFAKQQIASAEAMTKAELRALESDHGGINRYGNILTKSESNTSGASDQKK